MRGQELARVAQMEQREQTLEARETALVERERWVRETLERESGH